MTYPDGSVDNTTTNVRVVPNGAQENTPGYNGGSTNPGVGVNIPQTGDTQLPPNTRFEIPQGGVPSGWTVMFYPNHGIGDSTPPAKPHPGSNVAIPANVTYPDGPADNTTTNARVVPNDDQENTPAANGGSTTPGG
ncbi:hypothetical protein DOS62_04475, partial [Staphylococcus felis]|uniref:YPDG domain-containing protein n=1 Tax=Staphylococcus felis TaxID=46127 RepID=UPI000E38EC76